MAYTAKDYVLPEGLEHALEGAMALGQPLLLTGEPGTGKTTLADWVVLHLNEQNPGKYHDKVLRFQTKTTSTAQDLFYTYDALGHFQAANLSKSQAGPKDFIELQALGKAIAMSNPTPAFADWFRTAVDGTAKSTVVLIDEVDKAPRDFTNDILDEIDQRRFLLREYNQTLEKGRDADIVIIMTSNSEKNLPDAFLRRCAFYHIDFPQGDRLRTILKRHLGADNDYTAGAYKSLLDLFESIRDKAVRKKPATAELIGWLKMLGIKDYFDQPTARQKELLLHNLSFLVKTQEDLAVAKELVAKQFEG